MEDQDIELFKAILHVLDKIRRNTDMMAKRTPIATSDQLVEKILGRQKTPPQKPLDDRI